MKAKIFLIALSVSLLWAIAVVANDPPHNDAGGISCGECHGDVLFCIDPSSMDPGDLREMYEDVCLRCHTDTSGSYHAESAPLASGHKTAVCIDCHHPHYQSGQFWYGRKEYPSSYEIAAGSGSVTGTETIAVVGMLTEITFSSITLKGGWSLEDLAAKTSSGRGMVFLPDRKSAYNSRMIYSVTDNHDGTGAITVKGELSSVSASGFVVAYGQAVQRNVSFASASGEPVLFLDHKDEYSFAENDGLGLDGCDSTPNGICQVCHTAGAGVDHWRNDGTEAGHFSGWNCTLYCHKHTKGFDHCIENSPLCTGCHDSDRTDGAPETYCNDTLVNCSDCHHTGSHGIHLDLDDPKGPSVICSACHDMTNYPYFKSGTDGNGDELFDLSETDVCDTCHSPGGSYDGVSDSNLGVKYGSGGELKYNWYNGVYEADGAALKPGLEKWCATCHDEEAAQIQGVTAPNVIGDEDSDYIYGTGWGFYKTGHGLAAGEQYPSKGGVETLNGRPVECGSCHDYATAHIDGAARTFDDGDVIGLDPAIYRQGYRLKLIDGQEPYRMPRPSNIGNTSDQFRVCFQVGCHDSGPFTDSDNMNTNMVTDGTNKHAYHLNFNNQELVSADWSGAYNSRMTCVVCHNVHGSTQLAMVRDGKLIGREPGQRIWYKNDAVTYIKPTSTDPPIPEDLPLSASDGTAWLPASAGNLCAHCHPSNGFTGVNDRTPYQNIAQAPFLEWVGTSGLEDDGVAPNSAAGNSTFTFRVSYSDINNDSPSPIEVWVDLNDNDTYGIDEKFTMVATEALDTNLVDGKIFTKSLTITMAGDGEINYRFDASDGVLPASGEPTGNKTLTILKNPPVLTWTGENNYVDDGVKPDTGGDDQDYEFRVKYIDADNDAPASVDVLIDRNDDGDYLDSGEVQSMDKVGGTTDYENGEIYTITLTLDHDLPTTGDAIHNYRFQANDGTDNAVGSPTSGSKVTVLADPNNPPYLEWVDGYCRTEGVKPAYGAIGADFEFYVKYTDPDGDCPTDLGGGFVRITIDGTTDNMGEVDGDDSDCSDGKYYSYTTALNTAGIFNYNFSAQDDGGAAAYGDPILTPIYGVEVVDALKVRPTEGTGWYTTIQAAIDAVDGAHTVLVYDGTYSEDVVLSGSDDSNTALRSVCGPDTTIINGSGSGTTVTFGRWTGNLIDGFQVTGGTTGIAVNGTQVTINNCQVHDNNGLDGGGISVAQSGDMPTLTLTNSEIYNNSSDSGGGVRIWRGTGHIISNSIIRNNTVTGDSMADGGGGVHLFQIAEITISNSVIRDNISDYPGGGLYVSQVPDTTGAGLTVSDSFINGNTTVSSGGGIYSDLSNIKFVRSSITGNTAGTKGGALARPGAGNTASFENCILADNQASQAGMAKLNGGTLDIINSTIANNRSTDHSGAIYSQLATITIRNSILWGNQAATLGHIASFNGGSMTITDSIIQSGGYGDFTNPPYFNGNVTPVVSGFASEDDPWFVGDGNYHIQAFSPAVDNASVIYAPDDDIDGEGRTLVLGGDGLPDIGSDEY